MASLARRYLLRVFSLTVDLEVVILRRQKVTLCSSTDFQNGLLCTCQSCDSSQTRDTGLSLAISEGYSSGARPDKVEDYNYNILRDDIFNVADAVNFAKFHLVAHDHGAALDFTQLPRRGEKRALYPTLHSAFRIWPLSPMVSTAQLPTWISRSPRNTLRCLCSQTARLSITGFGTTAWALRRRLRTVPRFRQKMTFQKALWWYNGAYDAGVMASPPLMSAGDLFKHGAIGTAGLRELFGGTPNAGHGASNRIGAVKMPTLFVCGKSDSSILCSKPYAKKTSEYCPGGYTYLEVDCGHDVLSCTWSSETKKVTDAIVAHIKAVAPTPTEDDIGKATEDGVSSGNGSAQTSPLWLFSAAIMIALLSSLL